MTPDETPDRPDRRRVLIGGTVLAGAAVVAAGVAAGVFGDENADSQEPASLRDFALAFDEWLGTVSAEGSADLAQLIAELRTLNDQVLAATAPTTTTEATTTTVAPTTTTEVPTTTTVPGPEVLWPGHQPGSTYIGLNGVSATLDYPEAVERWFGQWTSDTTEHTRINQAHATNRLPWMSFKGPTGGWAAISNGSADSAIRAKARRYAAYTQPVLATFHHEPWGDGTAAQFEDAFFHILDIMEDEVESLGQTTFCPIFNGHNLHLPNEGGAYFASGQFVERCPFIGWDNYGKAPDIVRMFDALDTAGAKSTGCGEFGRGPGGDGVPAHTLAEYTAKLDLFRLRRDNLAVVCYWNSAFHTFANNPHPNGAAYRALWSAYQTETCRLSDL